SSDGSGFHSRGAAHSSIAKTISNVIHRLVKVHHLLAVLKQVSLISTAHQMTKSNTYQTHQHPSMIKLVEKFLNHRKQKMIRASVSDMALQAVRRKVGIANFHCHASREFISATQLKSEIFRHGRQQVFELVHIDGVALKSAFCRYRLSL